MCHHARFFIISRGSFQHFVAVNHNIICSWLNSIPCALCSFFAICMPLQISNNTMFMYNPDNTIILLKVKLRGSRGKGSAGGPPPSPLWKITISMGFYSNKP